MIINKITDDQRWGHFFFILAPPKIWILVCIVLILIKWILSLVLSNKAQCYTFLFISISFQLWFNCLIVWADIVQILSWEHVSYFLFLFNSQCKKQTFIHSVRLLDLKQLFLGPSQMINQTFKIRCKHVRGTEIKQNRILWSERKIIHIIPYNSVVSKNTPACLNPKWPRNYTPLFPTLSLWPQSQTALVRDSKRSQHSDCHFLFCSGYLWQCT